MAEEIEAQAELEQSKQTSARLMEQLARKIGASRSVQGAAGIGRAVRTHPVWWAVLAGFAGFAAGNLIRALGHRSK